jgi:tetratricopeptide (TPR) repeat protein
MKTGGFLVCPACGTRNKSTWEFCVRCGESLEGAEKPVAATRSTTAPPETESSAPGWKAALGSVLLIGLAIAAFLYIRQANATAPDEKAFLTIPTMPSAVPPGRAMQPKPTGPGAKDFAEGMRLFQAKQYADALPLLASAAAAEPGNAEYLNTWAQALWDSGARDQAVDRYREAAALSPRYQVPLARALEQVGRSDEALRAMESAASNMAEDDPNRVELAHMLYRAGKYDLALPILQAAAPRYAGDVHVQQELAFAAGKAGDHATEERTYRGILAKRPDATVSRAQLAESLFQQGKKDEAFSTLREGLSADRAGSAVLHSTLGSLLDQAGKPREALAEYKQAVQLGAGSEFALKVASRIAELERTLPAAGNGGETP